MNQSVVNAVGKVDTQVAPRGTLELLSRREVDALAGAGSRCENEKLFELFRRCALAVLSTGTETDDAAAIYDRFHDFDIAIERRTRGLKLQIKNAPASAFVERRMIEGIRQHLFAVLRDIVYIGTEIENSRRFDLATSAGITDAVFDILKHAGVLRPDLTPNLVVCWGGHAISREEYDYTKEVGYQLGLRGLDICTGCGPGAMKGPMKGAAVGHAKQRRKDSRLVGLTEPGIIGAEPPNPMVGELVILPDIEKRLEAFLRLGHAIVVFPGGVGTIEEVLYLLGVLMHPDNERSRPPAVFTGPESSREYYEYLERLILLAFGKRARRYYKIVIGDARSVANTVARKVKTVRNNRRKSGDAFYFNWLLKIAPEFQRPFDVTHENVASLSLHRDLPEQELAANLRRMFSALVTGNVKDYGIRMIQRHGPFEIRGDPAILEVIDDVLTYVAREGRMKLRPEDYRPCYRVLS
ncbi:MAG: nucleotide 5'-monophosphate nucleosidase PpnN [Gammaproteobacteria bacterium]|nr:nucleotide 5'-monophosphate nucleosidase PpnN [Gammaproteobacteria bacterium]